MNISPAMVLLLAEIAAVSTILLCIILLIIIKKKLRDKTASSLLVEKLKNKEGEQLNMLVTLLKNTYHYDDEQAQKTAREMLNKEYDFYKKVIGIYVRREAKALVDVDDDFNRVTESYRALMRWTGAGNPATEDGKPVDSDIAAINDVEKLKMELDALQQTNTKLTRELNEARSEVDQSMKEYETVYMKKAEQKAQQAVAVPQDQDAAAKDDEPAAVDIDSPLDMTAKGEDKLSDEEIANAWAEALKETKIDDAESKS